MENIKTEGGLSVGEQERNGWRELEGLNENELLEELRRRRSSPEPLLTVEEVTARLKAKFPEAFPTENGE